MQLCEVTG